MKSTHVTWGFAALRLQRSSFTPNSGPLLVFMSLPGRGQPPFACVMVWMWFTGRKLFYCRRLSPSVFTPSLWRPSTKGGSAINGASSLWKVLKCCTLQNGDWWEGFASSVCRADEGTALQQAVLSPFSLTCVPQDRRQEKSDKSGLYFSQKSVKICDLFAAEFY